MMIKYLQIIVLTLCVPDISNFRTEKYASPGQYSYVVSIWRNSEYLCSGIIINERHILTRVLCINNIASSELSVIAGTVKTDYQYRQILRVKHIHIHYDFATVRSRATDELRWKNDIAVLQLQHELIWHAYIQSGSFFTGSSNEARLVNCQVTGWRPISRGSSDYALIWIEAKIMNDTECELLEPLQNEKFLTVDTRATVGSTKFDGSPVLCNNLIVGMITGGKNGRARTFIDLFHYTDFIAHTIDDGKTDVECGENPYIVSIWNRGFYECGGIIMTEIHILTAAHCIFSTERIDLRVVAGCSQVLPKNKRIEWLLVDHVRIYDCTSGLAILTIEPRSIWGSIRTPAVFQSVWDAPTTRTCDVYRWHRAYDIDGETLMQLVRTSEKILNYYECQDSGVHLRENQFCTTGPYLRHSANIENIGNPIMCAGMVFGIMIPTDTSSTLPSRFTTFLKISAYTQKLSDVIQS